MCLEFKKLLHSWLIARGWKNAIIHIHMQMVKEWKSKWDKKLAGEPD